MTTLNGTGNVSTDAFFSEIAAWTVVESTETSTHYAWTGRWDRNDGQRVGAKLYSLRNGRVISTPVAETGQCHYEIVRDSDGTAQTLPDHVREIVLAYMTQVAATESLRTDYRKAEADFDKVGELLMAEAESRSWCSDYDKLVDEWNDQMTIFQLPKRKSDYDVEVTITATYTVTVKVEDMEDEDAARDYVHNMDSDELMNESGGSWNYPDECDFEVNDVSLHS